jgi:hypothetical protein
MMEMAVATVAMGAVLLIKRRRTIPTLTLAISTKFPMDGK